MSILLSMLIVGSTQVLVQPQPTLLARDAKPCVKLNKRWQRKSNWGEFWYGFNHPTDLGIRSVRANSSTRINGETYSSSTTVYWTDPGPRSTPKMADFHSPEFMAQREQEYNDAKCPIPEK
jgi:hypothetical protein